MSKTIYQNPASTSCYNSETTTTTLKLKVTAPPPIPTTFNDLFFHHSAPIENKSLYTHPLLENSSSFSRLSAKSLELCTEYLGSETGTEYSTPNHLDIELEESKHSTKSLNKPLQVEKNKSFPKTKSFPPPLSTLSGSKSLQVRRYREGGRLIIEAVETPIRSPCLQAERSNGRLRLCILSKPIIHANKEEQKEEEEEEDDSEETENEEMNMETKMEKFGRMRNRCNGSETLCSNWKPAIWVATS